MPSRYSHSMIGSYENCPLKFKYSYIERKPKTLGNGIEAFMGSRVHDVLEQLYMDVQMQRLPSLEEVLALYEKEWDAQYSNDLRIVKKRFTAEDYRKVGRKCLTHYYEKNKPFDKDKTIGTEIQVNIKLRGEQEYKIIGYIDRLSETEPGHYQIHDYKTSNSLPSQAQLDEDRQLALYSIAVKEMYPDAKEIDLIWHYVVHDKEMKSVRTEQEIAQLKEDIVKKIEAIEVAVKREEFPAKPSMLCHWCEYQNVCPMQKHLYATELLGEGKYKNDSGVQLVDKLQHFHDLKKDFLSKMEPEVQAIEDALTHFAEKEDIKVIAGSKMNVKIMERSMQTLPGKGTDEENYILELLDKEGKKHEFIALDKTAVLHAVKEKQFSEETLKELHDYIKENHSSSIRLVGKKE